MRTKTIERKRYSLRGKKEKREKKKENVDSKSKCEKKENRVPAEKPSHPPAPTGSTKRKKAKPVKTLQKDEVLEEEHEKSKNSNKQQNNPSIEKNPVTLKETENEKTKEDNNSNKSDSPVKTKEIEFEEEEEEEEEDDDSPVHNALEHAIECQDSSNCAFPKCSIAKQFLVHCASCSKMSDECTICKAMDIMVCKHAQICNVSLERCCPIPFCDKVRLMVLEEWVKLKHKHNEMMQRVFRGLIHAKKCKDKDCDMLLCKNIKAVLVHTHSCSKDENCKTKKFIIQLCEHHQQSCTNENCEVEFCEETRKKKEACENIELEQESAIQNIHDNKATEICENAPEVTTIPTNNYIFQSNCLPWDASLMENQQICYATNESVPVNPFNAAQQQFHQITTDASQIQTNIQDATSQQVSNLFDGLQELPTPKVDNIQSTNENNNNNGSPTEDMYYQLWRGRDDPTKNTLPRLSPNELQAILMSRVEDQQILSPVSHNRATYSEVQPIQQPDHSSRSSQESELEENPLPRYEDTIQPISNDQSANSIFQQLQEVQQYGEGLKDQGEWSKIDFIRQQMYQQGLDIETETADEDSDGLSKFHGDYTKRRKMDESNNLTCLERAYLTNLRN